VEPEDFACLVTRDLPLAPKPSPESVLHVARELGIEVGKLMMVGDHAFDIQAGVRAGALTMFLRHGPGRARQAGPVESDFVVDDLAEASQVMRRGLPLSKAAGRVPGRER
jgi:phosphoglycolate phosphatase-like HAD superfamily hydrolase